MLLLLVFFEWGIMGYIFFMLFIFKIFYKYVSLS